MKVWRWYLVVQALMTLDGVDRAMVTTLGAEPVDLRRFSNARELMGFLGLVPSDHTSSSYRRNGVITRTGNSYARRILWSPLSATSFQRGTAWRCTRQTCYPENARRDQFAKLLYRCTKCIGRLMPSLFDRYPCTIFFRISATQSVFFKTWVVKLIRELAKNGTRLSHGSKR